ncbi:MAG: hypothetical protein I3273_01165 [Candidatus Moeniiplasma glomeromycotorum]|nr:hypothetical protein [Candidatus Moeniiplasma glomeromycotorum]MCE8167268.1 hypothetical protein [Candidatus Moeniiplasma glomeromycotorum]MCE8168719.1 hypothetical protein [Candidatus Moeniiplasma glomeromycotorum]
MKEIIIIETQNGKKIKEFLEKEHENYRVYQEAESEEEFWRRSVHLASQDKQRNKEIEAWDKIASKVK